MLVHLNTFHRAEHYLWCCNPVSLLCDAFSLHNICAEKHIYSWLNSWETFSGAVIQLIWSLLTVSHSFPFFFWNIFITFPAKNSVRARADQHMVCVSQTAFGKIFLARGIHCCPNIFYLFYPTRVCILYTICVHTHDCVETVCELPLLRNNTAVELDVSVRTSLHMRREEKPTRCHWMVYCTYNMLNMFQTLLCPSSGARDYMCVTTAYGVQCLVAGCRRSGAEHQAMRPGREMLHVRHPSSWTRSLLSCTWPPTTNNQALHTVGGSNAHIASNVWWWA